MLRCAQHDNPGRTWRMDHLGLRLQFPPTVRSEDRRLRRWAWWLTALTIGWNSLEAVIAIVSGLLAGSIALVGFGLDSVVEVSSALVIAWRLSRQGEGEAANERAERRAVRL